ncbi:MAG: hypothetical protein ABIS67_04445, partial [Candidatus Eisenbacteria bacterium]
MIRAPRVAVATLLMMFTATLANAQWMPNGVSLSGGISGDVPSVAPDGIGGAFVAWRNNRNDGDVLFQHITAAGLIAPGWPPAGLPLAVLPGPQYNSDVIPDGSGGALVVWQDLVPDPVNGADAVVQRIQPDGSFAPGWPAAGVRILAPGRQEFPQIAPDGAGGVYVVWWDDRNYVTHRYDVYAQHLLGDGTVAPGWPEGGLAIAAQTSNVGSPSVVADGLGSAVFAWADDRNNLGGVGDTYASRVLADGSLAPGWIAGGNRIAQSRPDRGLATDGVGGFYLWTTTAGELFGFDGQYYVQRIAPDGLTASGWPEGGLLVCDVPFIRSGLDVQEDGLGGVLASWYDYRPPYDFTGGEIFALRVLPGGVLAPGWTANGTLVSDPNNAAYESGPHLAGDGGGGAYIVWDQNYPSAVQHVTASGQIAAGWPVGGVRLADNEAQFDARVAPDGSGGAIVVWDENTFGRRGIWAQRYVMDGIVAVQLSLVSAVADVDRVRLEWFAADGAGLVATLHRRTEGSAWGSLATISADGTGHLRYEDRDVIAGTRYAYRLGYPENGEERLTSETWVELPAAWTLALEGFRPNPAVGAPVVSLTLANSAPGRIELFDLAGRRVA